MKTYNESRGVTWLILNLDPAWRWVVNCTPQPCTDWIGGWFCSRAPVWTYSRRQKSLVLAGIQPLACPVRSLNYLLWYHSSNVVAIMASIIYLKSPVDQHFQQEILYAWEFSDFFVIQLCILFALHDGDRICLCNLPVFIDILHIQHCFRYHNVNNMREILFMYNIFSMWFQCHLKKQIGVFRNYSHCFCSDTFAAAEFCLQFFHLPGMYHWQSPGSC